jgi:hypothetical protein
MKSFASGAVCHAGSSRRPSNVIGVVARVAESFLDWCAVW